MKNVEILNKFKDSGYKAKKLIDVKAKIVFYTSPGEEGDYLGIRIYLPSLIKDQIKKNTRVYGFNSFEVEERERGEEVNIVFEEDGTAVIDTGYHFFNKS